MNYQEDYDGHTVDESIVRYCPEDGDKLERVYKYNTRTGAKIATFNLKCPKCGYTMLDHEHICTCGSTEHHNHGGQYSFIHNSVPSSPGTCRICGYMLGVFYSGVNY